MGPPYCIVCGEYHLRGRCPLWDEPPPPPPRKIHAKTEAETEAEAVQGRVHQEAPGADAVAQETAFDPAGRPYTPDDMKQEEMPVAKPVKARFDRTTYQRELMRRRAAAKKADVHRIRAEDII